MKEQRLLESWKEIAAYLKRSIRTCRRWEIELGLPIHRLDGTPSARVFAYPEELDQWMEAKLNHAEATARERAPFWRRKKKWLLVGSASTVALAALGFLVRQLLIPASLSLPPHNPFLAVLPFESVTGEAGLEPWTTALPDLLITDLKQSRIVNIIPITALFRDLHELKMDETRKFSPEDLKKINEKLHSDYTATGSLAKTGDTIAIKVLIWNSKTGELTKELKTACHDEEEFFGRVDELSKETKYALGLTSRQIARDIDDKVNQISTTSPPAFQLYSKACRLGISGECQAVIPLFQKAVELDPRFGLAYIHLYNSCYCSERFEDMVKYGQKAFELSDRMSEKEKLLLQADYYMYFKTVDKRLEGKEDVRSTWRKLGPKELPEALKINERLWSLYPDFPEDEGGQIYLPRLYLELEEWDKTVQILERLNLGGNKQPGWIQHIIECYRAVGLLDKAEKILEAFEKEHPGEVGWRTERTAIALDRGKLDDALKSIEAKYSKGEKKDFSYYNEVGYAYWAHDELDAAEKNYRTVVDPKSQGEVMQRIYNLEVLYLSQGKIRRAIEQANQLINLSMDMAKDSRDYVDLARAHHYDLAYLYRLSGLLPDALKAAEECCRNYEKRGLYAIKELHLKALILLEMSRMEDFDRQAEEIRGIIEKEARPKYMKYYYHLLGHREMKNKNFNMAIAYFEQAAEQVAPGESFYFPRSDPWPAKYYFSLAEAIELAGEKWEDKRRIFGIYEKLPALWVMGSFSGDLHARSFYKRAKAYDLYYQWRAAMWEDYRKKAIENYRKFLSLWGDADPIFSEVEDARKRLAVLESK